MSNKSIRECCVLVSWKDGTSMVPQWAHSSPLFIADVAGGVDIGGEWME